MTITLFLGTSRAGSQSQQVFSYLHEQLSAAEVSLTSVTLRDVVIEPKTIRAQDDATATTLHDWQAQVEASDAIVMVIPEYNHSFPGEWKLAMDALSPSVCAGKRVFLATVSAGTFAGVRVAEHVQPVLHTLGFSLAKEKLHVASVGDTFTDTGVADEVVKARVASFIEVVVSAT